MLEISGDMFFVLTFGLVHTCVFLSYYSSPHCEIFYCVVIILKTVRTFEWKFGQYMTTAPWMSSPKREEEKFDIFSTEVMIDSHCKGGG